MHPILIKGLPFHSYGFMLFIGFVCAYALGRKLAIRDRVPITVIGDVLAVSIISGVLGARILYALLHPQQVSSILDFFKIWQGGLVFYGGVALGSVAVVAYVKWRRVPLGRLADIVAPCIALGLIFGRIGCFLNGCCWGRVAPPEFALAVRFPRIEMQTKEGNYLIGSYAYLEHLRRGLIKPEADHSLPVHPVQLYASFNALLITLLLLLFRRWRQWDGQVFVLFGMLYPAARFIEEVFRDDTPPEQRVRIGGYSFTAYQLMSVGIFLLCALFVIIYPLYRTRSQSRST